MKFTLENPVLVTDLDAKTFDVLNCNELQGADNVIYSVDPRMTDARNILAGTVTDASVADNAGIVQSKLSLNGTIPADWLGTDDTTAARGDLYQPISQKDQINGYVSLNGSSKLPSGTVPLSGTGTVTALELDLPSEFAVVPNVSTSVWTFAGYWAAEQPETFLGNVSGSSQPPKFSSPMYLAMIPNLDASNFASGTFNTARLPVAVGVGGSHAIGIAPDPTEKDGIGSDYLARDMTYKPMSTPIAYQPTLPDPSISIQSYAGPVAVVNITEKVDGTNLFYNLSTGMTDIFIQVTSLPLLIGFGVEIMAYASKIGYNNSAIVKFTVPDPGAIT